MANWNPWHGCRKYSEGCQHCYVYRIDSAHGKDASQIFLNKDFDLPMRRRRDKSYLIPPGSRVYTCFSSDFLLEEADLWRDRAWEMIRWRSDLQFLFITKRILRLQSCLPPDWGEGYENVHICCTVENQRQADIRLPVYCKAPIRHKSIICSPLLGPIDLRPYLSDSMEEVVVGGESGEEAQVQHPAVVADPRFLPRLAADHNLLHAVRKIGAQVDGAKQRGIDDALVQRGGRDRVSAPGGERAFRQRGELGEMERG